MKKLILTIASVAALLAIPAPPASADVSSAQHLPVAACGSGTMNAHESIPETTGTGLTTPAHEAVPGTENVTSCGHGG
jgi:hypothetical protein